MRLGIVTGQVISTVRISDMPAVTWLLVEELDKQARPTGRTKIAADPLGVGEGELVVMVTGSSARRALPGEVPVDLTIVGIVDSITSAKKEIYGKHLGIQEMNI